MFNRALLTRGPPDDMWPKATLARFAILSRFRDMTSVVLSPQLYMLMRPSLRPKSARHAFLNPMRESGPLFDNRGFNAIHFPPRGVARNSHRNLGRNRICRSLVGNELPTLPSRIARNSRIPAGPGEAVS
jgi:hypothetical protein